MDAVRNLFPEPEQAGTILSRRTSAALSFLAAVLYIPHLGAVFRFAALDWPDLMIAIGAASLAVLCLEIVKLARREPPSLG